MPPDHDAFGIDANAGFHAQVPLVTLLRLPQLRVTLLVLVLGRTRRRNQRGIHHRAALHRSTGSNPLNRLVVEPALKKRPRTDLKGLDASLSARGILGAVRQRRDFEAITVFRKKSAQTFQSLHCHRIGAVVSAARPVRDCDGELRCMCQHHHWPLLQPTGAFKYAPDFRERTTCDCQQAQMSPTADGKIGETGDWKLQQALNHCLTVAEVQ